MLIRAFAGPSPRLLPNTHADATRAMSTELLQSYYDWANATEAKLLDWVDPEGGWKVHPMADYPLANFASVYAICVGYLLFVILGTVRPALRRPRSDGPSR
jgi:hypothetical protein